MSGQPLIAAAVASLAAVLARKSAPEARLRPLLVEPAARGTGLGTGLVAECVDFAHSCGYSRIILRTNDALVAARRIYRRAGFGLVSSEPQSMFGCGPAGEDRELALQADVRP